MPVRNRRQAREAALSALYLIEVGKEKPEDVLDSVESIQELSDELRAFANELVLGVRHHRASLDQLISANLKQYSLNRVAIVDKNVLRIACFELYHLPDVPPKVSLDEAIELAKKFSTAESGRFVNGVLGAILPQCPKADWKPEPGAEEPAPPEPEPEALTITEDSPEIEELVKVGKWKIRTEELS